MNLNQNILVKLNQAGFRIKDKWLVRGVSLQIEKGQIVTLIGPNGSGKVQPLKLHWEFIKKLMERLKNIQIKLVMFLKKFQSIGHCHLE